MKEKGEQLKQATSGPSLVRNKFQQKMFLIPSLVTVLGIFCGFLAILTAVKGHYAYACKCIGLAIVLDGLDGRIARKLNATSDFGKEFDSLSDVIALGLAPAIIAYSWAFKDNMDEFGILISFCFLVCAATRLARFNIDTETTTHFSGLPMPGAAGAIIALVYFMPTSPENIYVVSGVVAYSLLVSILMVSLISYPSVKNIKLTDGNPKKNLLFVAVIVALTWYNPKAVMLLVANAYLFSGPIMAIIRKKTATEEHA